MPANYDPFYAEAFAETPEEPPLADQAREAAVALAITMPLVIAVMAALEDEGKADDPGYQIAEIALAASEKIAEQVNKGTISREADRLLLIGLEHLYRGVTVALGDAIDVTLDD